MAKSPLLFIFSILTFTAMTANAAEDQRFMDEAVRGELAQLQLAKLATKRAKSEDLKDLARVEMQDHQRAVDALKEIAKIKEAKIPTQPGPGAKQEYDRLAKLSGAEFDREYLRFVLNDHKKDLKDFQTEANSGKDIDLKKFASDHVPITEQHRKRLQDMQAMIDSKSKGAGGGQAGGSQPKTR